MRPRGEARRLKAHGVAAAPQVPATEEDLLISFKAFDADGDGYVTPAELKAVLNGVPGAKLSDADIADIVARCDLDGDGKLNFDEVIAAMKR